MGSSKDFSFIKEMNSFKSTNNHNQVIGVMKLNLVNVHFQILKQMMEDQLLFLKNYMA